MSLRGAVKTGLGVLLGILLFVTIGGAAVWTRALQPVDSNAEPILFVVPEGATLRHVAEELEAQKIIRDALALRVLARIRALDGRIRAGEFELSPAAATPAVLDHLIRGPLKTYTFSFPEGITARELARRLERAHLGNAARFLSFALDPQAASSLGVEGPTLEGYLFPETYQLQRSFKEEQVATIFVREFQRNWAELSQELGPTKRSMREVVTLASIVEKETGDPTERPLIAAVFENRLRLKMRLESDPTVIYGIANFDGNLTKAQLLDPKNPYNTYRIQGLPPGPITNPGRAALRSVLEPAQVPYLYFVSKNDGTHHFSTNYATHQRAVIRYQKRK